MGTRPRPPMVFRPPIPLLNLPPRVSVIRGTSPPLGSALCHLVHFPRCHPSRRCPLPVVLPSILGLQPLPLVLLPAQKLPNLRPHSHLTTVLLGQFHVLRRLERIMGLAGNLGACLPPANGRILRTHPPGDFSRPSEVPTIFRPCMPSSA